MVPHLSETVFIVVFARALGSVYQSPRRSRRSGKQAPLRSLVILTSNFQGVGVQALDRHRLRRSTGSPFSPCAPASQRWSMSSAIGWFVRYSSISPSRLVSDVSEKSARSAAGIDRPRFSTSVKGTVRKPNLGRRTTLAARRRRCSGRATGGNYTSLWNSFKCRSKNPQKWQSKIYHFSVLVINRLLRLVSRFAVSDRGALELPVV